MKRRLAKDSRCDYSICFFAIQANRAENRTRRADIAPECECVKVAMNGSKSIRRKSATRWPIESYERWSVRALVWGAPTAAERGPVIATLRDPRHRNAVGIARRRLFGLPRARHRGEDAASPTNSPTSPTPRRPTHIGPYPQWADAKKIVSLDPWGHLVGEEFRDYLARGYDIRPTDRDHPRQYRHAGDPRGDRGRTHPGRRQASSRHERHPRGEGGDRSGLVSARHRRALRHRARRAAPRACTSRPAACIPNWSSRPDLKVFLPPIGGTTIYCFGDPEKLADRNTPLACRVHDECNGSDVFGSDICTCRPYLAHGIEIVHPDGAGGRRRPRGLQPQGRPRARRGDQVPGLQRAQAPEGRRPARKAISTAPPASPASRTCGSRS